MPAIEKSPRPAVLPRPGLSEPARSRHRAPQRAAIETRRQLYWLVTGRVGGAALQAVSLGVLARATGPSNFGLAAGIVGVAQASIAFADLGISPSILRARAQDRGDSRIVRLQTINARVAGCLGLAWTAGLLAAMAFTDSRVPVLLLPIGVWVGCEKVTETRLMIPLADGRTSLLLTSLLLRRAACLATLLTSLAVGVTPVLAYSLGLSLAGAGGLLQARHKVARASPRAVHHDRRPLLRPALPFWIATLATQARLLDVTIVGLASSAQTAGLYAVPTRLTSALSLVPNSIAQVLLPAAARGDRQSLRTLFQSLTAVVTAMAACFGALALSAVPVITLVLGQDFAPAAAPLRVILLGLLFLSISSSMISLLQARGDERYVAGSSVGATLIGLAGIAIGARWAGALGAALGSALSYCVMMFLLVFRIRNRRAEFNYRTSTGTRPNQCGSRAQ